MKSTAFVAVDGLPCPCVLHVRLATDADEAASFAATEAAMRAHVEATWGGWNSDEQVERHRQSFNPATHQVVTVGGAFAGIMAVAEEESHVELEKLYLMPEFRNQGLGARLLLSVVERARRAGKPVRLRVLKVNTAAQRFYVEHGFRVESETPERVFMTHAG